MHPGSIPGEASIAAAPPQSGPRFLGKRRNGGEHSVGQPSTSPDFAALRRNMVDAQLRTYDVTSHRLLDAMERVPREAFVAANLRELAYSDRDMAVSAGRGLRTLLRPMVLGRLLQALDVQPGDKALDCAGGSGYGAALMAALGASVVAVESGSRWLRSCASGSQRLAWPASRSRRAISARARRMPGLMTSFSSMAPPSASRGSSGPARGRRTTGNHHGPRPLGRAVVFTRSGGAVGRRTMFDASAPALDAFATAPAFTF